MLRPSINVFMLLTEILFRGNPNVIKMILSMFLLLRNGNLSKFCFSIEALAENLHVWISFCQFKVLNIFSSNHFTFVYVFQSIHTFEKLKSNDEEEDDDIDTINSGQIENTIFNKLRKLTLWSWNRCSGRRYYHIYH